ncbi:hypothetical protein NLU66_00980 [Brachybacterium sp. NBEC-018]|uniref:hypothetical protein n=1 Tax=Brachybacterium sp. NBEC-018 TaxID=2996004 RepID=UPI0021754219|nr:hypothetical protein [Brachybacterium sp. NBEC-018]UVY84199.1 hypothetical protein NLU66_00980 [Brachybacterium sp. NBEC-018]
MSENPYDEVTTDGGEDRPDVDRDFTGPDGVQDADAILELERERDAEERTDSAADFPVELGEEDVAAAEQGNRDGDEMVAEGEDPREVAELDGDDEDVDAFEDEPFTEDDPLRRER